MITNTKKLEKYCTDYQNIQNYAEAVKSPLKFDLHHRLEIDEMQSRKQLIAENLYYGRPPEELIFLEHGEHTRLHQEGVNHKGENNPNFGKHPSAESRQRMSDAKKGEKCYMYGKPKSDETRRKISESRKGQLVSEETRRKISENNCRYWRGKPAPNKGKHWHLENGHRIWTD